MSSAMKWRPYSPPEGKHLGALKYALARRFYDHDGSLGGEQITIGAENLDFLEGVKAGRKDPDDRDQLQEMIDAIEKFGFIEIWMEA